MMPGAAGKRGRHGHRHDKSHRTDRGACANDHGNLRSTQQACQEICSRSTAQFAAEREIGPRINQRPTRSPTEQNVSNPKQNVLSGLAFCFGSDRMSEQSAIQRIKELDKERAALFEQAKDEALRRAKQAVEDLNALGLNYRLVAGPPTGNKTADKKEMSSRSADKKRPPRPA
jgi:hypothetical protein